jgi:hypothetical protein
MEKRKIIESFFKPIEIGTSSQSESQSNTEPINSTQMQRHEQNHAMSEPAISFVMLY